MKAIQIIIFTLVFLFLICINSIKADTDIQNNLTLTPGWTITILPLPSNTPTVGPTFIQVTAMTNTPTARPTTTPTNTPHPTNTPFNIYISPIFR